MQKWDTINLNNYENIIILCGGLGTRMSKILGNKPKSLTAIGSRTIIDLQLDLIETWGFKNVHLSLGHLGSDIENHIEKKYTGPLNINYFYDGKNTPLGTGGAIKQTIFSLDCPCFTIYGDSYLPNGHDFIDKVLGNFSAMSICKTPFNYEGNITKIDGKFIYDKTSDNLKKSHIDYGLNFFLPENFKGYPDVFDLSDLQSNLSKTEKLEFIEINSFFFEVGSQFGLDELSKFLNDSNR